MESSIVVVVASLLAALLTTTPFPRRRPLRSRGITASLHTLEVINEHPTDRGSASDPVEVPKHAYPESTVRVTDSATVRLTSRAPGRGAARSPPPETVEHVRAIDLRRRVGPRAPASRHPSASDPAIGSMNHRPRRLLAPGLAVLGGAGAGRGPAGVRVAPGAAAPPCRGNHEPDHHARPDTTTTTTAPPPAVSAPQVTSASDATYAVASTQLHAGRLGHLERMLGQRHRSHRGHVFSGVLAAGQQQTHPRHRTGQRRGRRALRASRPRSTGRRSTLPSGYQTPFTLHFTPPASAAS